MSAALPEILAGLAILLAVGFGCAAGLAACAAWHRARAVLAAIAPAPEGRRSWLCGAMVAFLAAANQRRMPPAALALAGIELCKAGNPRDLSPAQLAVLVEVSAGFFCLLGIVFSSCIHLGIEAPVLFALFGALLPLLWLRDRVRARQRAIARALPFDLDLLTLSVEAGLDFAASLGKVVEKGRNGPLEEELAHTLKELKLGKTREEALRNLADRVRLPAVTSFVHALVQADRMGTPLGKILRILAAQLRQERTQRAEKLANEAPVKLLIPLIGCIFPTIFLVLFGPIVYQVFLGGTF
jgi:tight adherence protein C